MAKTTITQFRHLAKDSNGIALPLGDGYLGQQTLTAAGAASALHDQCNFVRISTDTAYTVDVAKEGASSELLNAGASEHFAVNGGQILTFVAA